MENLKTMVAAAALYAAASALAPEKEGLRRAVTAALSLLFILSILPVGSLAALENGLSAPNNGEGVDEEAYAAYLKSAVEQSIEEDLAERFSIGDEDIRLSSDASYANGTVTVTRLEIALTAVGYAADVPSLLRYVKEYYGLECEVISLDA